MNTLIAVNGTLMRGLSLHENISSIGGEFLYETKTEKKYRLYSIDDKYPAMIKDENGESIDVEIYSLPYESLAKLLFKEPPGLVIGKLKTIDGTTMFGVLAEPYLVKDKKEITSFKGWRNYIKSRNL